MEQKDFSKKTVLALVVLTVVISALGVLLVSYESSQVVTISATEHGRPTKATGKLSLTVAEPPQTQAQVKLVVLES